LEIHLFPDALIGVAAGVASQYVLVPILEALLLPFVPHLFHRLSGPAVHLTSGAHGVGLFVLGFLVCVGSPCVEELFFRGLLLRSLAGRFAMLSKRSGPILCVGLTAVCFGLAHFEALQLIGLVGFGVVLGSLAWRTGRLGPGIVAHAAFNAVTFVALVGPFH
jgi:membrane protease YdiL (CAAX protease family)